MNESVKFLFNFVQTYDFLLQKMFLWTSWVISVGASCIGAVAMIAADFENPAAGHKHELGAGEEVIKINCKWESR